MSSKADPARPVAVRRGDEVYLRAQLFSSPALGGEWLRVPEDGPGEVAERLEAELGAAMAGYLFAPGFPANGAETAAEALAAAAEVVPETPGAGEVSGYRILLDAGPLG